MGVAKISRRAGSSGRKPDVGERDGGVEPLHLEDRH